MTNCPIIDLNDYEIQDNILEYHNNDVYSAIDQKTGKKVVIKMVDKNIFIKNYQNFLINEINASSIGISGIAKVIGYRLPLTASEIEKSKYKNSKPNFDGYITVYDLSAIGNLSTLTKEYLSSKGSNNDKMNPTIRSKIIFGVASIMRHLHERKIINRLLHNCMILLDEKKEPKIFNLTASTSIESFQKVDLNYIRSLCPVLELIAPERICDDRYDDHIYGLPVDVFSFAILLYSMFSLDFKLNRILRVDSPGGFFEAVKKGVRPKYNACIPAHYWNLMQKCWAQDPNERPTFDEIVEILKNDKFAIEEFGMKTDMDELHEYQKRIDE